MKIDQTAGMQIQQLDKTMQKSMFNSQLVTKTLDTINSAPTSSGLNSDYDFQKSVLMGGAVAKGSIVDTSE